MRVLKASFLLPLATVALVLTGAAPAPARTFVSVGIGFGPVWPVEYGPYWHWRDPYWRWHDPYWAPPPPAFYAPYPAPVMVPPPVVYQAVPAAPAVVAVAPAPKPASAKSYDTSDCREYTTTISIAGKPAQQAGTACRQPDGTWRIVN